MSNEKKIRECLREHYSEKFPNAYIRDEFTQQTLYTRNDLFIVDPSVIISIEIKSDADNLKRLEHQVLEYKTYSSYVVIALDIKHQKKFYKEFASNDLFRDVGVLFYENDKLQYARSPYGKKYPMMYPLMWGSELKCFLGKLKGRSKVGSSIDELQNICEQLFTYRELHTISKYMFNKRIRKTGPYAAKYSPVLDNDELQELILTKQDIFNKIIKQ